MKAKNPLFDYEAAIGDAMILLGAIDAAVDDAWNKLDDILQSIRDGHYNASGQFVG